MLIRSMVVTMKNAQGIGLAAPQVGINKQIIVVDVGQGPQAMINPEIIRQEGQAEMEEGCLSVPHQTVKIIRPYTIVVKYLDVDNCEQVEEYADILSRAVQHEIDHLHGKLIVDYTDSHHEG
jgi:peptide deformylase